MSKHIIALLIVASTLASAQNQGQVIEGMSTERLARIDTRIQQAIKDNWFPGAVVLIIRNNKPVYFKSFGKSDLEASTDMKRDNIFRIASQTKAITSLAVMMMYEEGKFQLDDPVSKFIPEFRNPQVLSEFNANDTTYKTTPAEKEITIRHLLTHTSGISYAAIGSSEFNAIYAKASVPSGIGNAFANLGDKMKILGKLPIKHTPGESFTYGLNVDVLGYLVEIWSGLTLSDFFETQIFKPLGMKDTYFYLPDNKHQRLVPVYEEVNGKLAKVTHQIYDNVDPWYPRLKGQYYSGGAGLSSTAEDYSKFLQLFLNKGEYNGKRLLSRKTVELMLTNQTGDMATQFGLGFELETALNDYQDPTSIGSFSWGGAFNTTYWADPKENLVALLYTQIYQSHHREIGSLFKALTYQAIVD
ncbi:MAG TPA: serine hydrolase domain-containing protein [Cyclobacteriaceae bacterium]|nr:serine hydrolase domain-containing protein [Cyclobacteriaceae bacterium]HRX00518.1 serine hydrolase domain-containing protein [Cyclobacteriaceae bacterium]